MKILVEGYYYLFFRLWRWHRKYFGDSDLPHLNATLNLGLLLSVNLMTLILLAELGLGFRLASWSKAEGAVAVVLIGIVLYSIFFYKERYKTIIMRFQDVHVDVNRSIRFISNAYPIITFVGIIVVGYLAWGIDSR